MPQADVFLQLQVTLYNCFLWVEMDSSRVMLTCLLLLTKYLMSSQDSSGSAVQYQWSLGSHKMHLHQLLLHTHGSNLKEIEWINKFFPVTVSIIWALDTRTLSVSDVAMLTSELHLKFHHFGLMQNRPHLVRAYYKLSMPYGKKRRKKITPLALLLPVPQPYSKWVLN